MEIRQLVNLLLREGWVLSGYNDFLVNYCKQFTSSRFGTLTYTVRISATGKGTLESRKFSVCHLIGPALNAKSGAYVPHASLGEWKTLSGAVDGVSLKYKAAQTDFQTKEANLAVKYARKGGK